MKEIIYNNRTVLAALLILTGLLSPSCNREAAPCDAPGEAISFGVQGGGTRATAWTTSNISSFGVGAVSGEGEVFFDDQLVEGGNGHWAYAPVKLWPQTGSMSFSAYAPFGTASNGISAVYDDSGEAFSLSYTLPASPANQADILVAPNVTVADVTSRPSQVTFTFSHILSLICVKAKYTADNPPVGTAVALDELTLGGRLVASAEYSPSDGWSDQSLMVSDYTYSWDDDDLAVAALSTSYQTVVTDAIGVYAIPYTSALSVTLYVKYTVSVPGTAPETVEESGAVSLSLEEGKRYTLQVNLDVETGIQVGYTVDGLNAWNYPSPQDGPMDVQ